MICFSKSSAKFLSMAIMIALITLHSTIAAAAEESQTLLSYNRTSSNHPNLSVAQQVQAIPNTPAPNTPATSLPNPPTTQKTPSKKPQRQLAPPTRSQIATPKALPSTVVARSPSLGLPKIESFATAGAGLGIVLGLFLLCMCMLRRSGPKPTSPLPNEVVRVLGRIPLAARNFAHLIHLGNKLVLVAITPDGVSTIAEVTDPHEVQRLLGLCLHNQKHSTTAEFHNVLEQLAKEPAHGFLGKEATASYAG